MPNTRQLLTDYLKTAQHTPGYADPPIFLNQYGTALTRRGVSYLVDKYVQQARSLASFHAQGRITPHVFRHSRAVHMLQAGINLVYIRDFLGHATVTSTEIYARADTEMKRQALERVDYGLDVRKMPAWERDGELMAWLEGLCR
jgi:site-specific recombinase XerD